MQYQVLGCKTVQPPQSLCVNPKVFFPTMTTTTATFSCVWVAMDAYVPYIQRWKLYHVTYVEGRIAR